MRIICDRCREEIGTIEELVKSDWTGYVDKKGKVHTLYCVECAKLIMEKNNDQ